MLPAEANRKPSHEWSAAVVSGVVCIAILFGRFFVTSWDKVAGDDIDTRFLIYVCEHWRLWALGKVALLDPGFFYPEKGLFAYSEVAALYAIPYSLFRALGSDQYLAYEATLWAVRFAGHLSAFYLLRRVFRVEIPAALFGSSLVTIGNVYFLSMGHTQLFSVSIVLLIAALFAFYCLHRQQSRPKALGTLSVASILTGLMTLTCIYVSFFAALLGMATAISFWIGRLIRRDVLFLRRRFLGDYVLALALVVVSCYPAYWLYKPALQKSDWRSMETTRRTMVDWKSALDPSLVSDLWNLRLNRPLGDRELGHRTESPRTWPPLTLVLIAAALVWTVTGVVAKAPDRRETFIHAFLWSSVAIYLCCVLFPMTSGEWSAWPILRNWIPGAKAIRAPLRFAVVGHVAIAFTLAYLLHRFLSPKSRPILGVLAAICLAEQINWHEFQGLSRFGDLARLGSLPSPPPQCRVFAIDDFQVKTPAYQVDTMLLSQRWGIPTINGYTGFEPFDWNLHVDDPNYSGLLRRWALRRGIADGFCVLDFEQERWRIIAARTLGRIPIGKTVAMSTESQHVPELLESGWRGPTAEGIWMDGGSPKLRFGLINPPNRDLELQVELVATTPRPLRIDVEFAGKLVGQWTIENGVQQRKIQLPKPAVDQAQLVFYLSQPATFPPGSGSVCLLLKNLRLD